MYMNIAASIKMCNFAKTTAQGLAVNMIQRDVKICFYDKPGFWGGKLAGSLWTTCIEPHRFNAEIVMHYGNCGSITKTTYSRP